MAYRAKKKNVGAKIVVWICLLTMVISSVSAILIYLFM